MKWVHASEYFHPFGHVNISSDEIFQAGFLRDPQGRDYRSQSFSRPLAPEQPMGPSPHFTTPQGRDIVVSGKRIRRASLHRERKGLAPRGGRKVRKGVMLPDMQIIVFFLAGNRSFDRD
jgi:hypothetical protein